MNVELVLLIILSIGFFVLLVLSSILVYILITTMRHVRRIAEKTEEATDNLANIMKTAGKRAAPMAVASMVAALTKWYRIRKETKDG